MQEQVFARISLKRVPQTWPNCKIATPTRSWFYNKSFKVNRHRFAKKVGSRTRHKCDRLYLFFAFWRHLADLGLILDTAGFQRGSPNLLGHHVGKMTKKGCPKTRPSETSNFYWNLIPKWEDLLSKNKHFAWYVAQNTSYRGVVTYK